jgi:hypothetical protein
MKPPIYGYMRAYHDTEEEEVMKDELQMFRWAQAENYELAAIYREVDDGSIAGLTDLVQELNRTGTRAVVVPSIEHFGAGALLQEHLWAYVVHTANAEVYEVSDQ